jgi:hypothetical protein
MSRGLRFASLAGVAVVCIAASAAAQAAAPLAGLWSLNPTLSEMPKEIGFNVDWMPAPDRGGSGQSSARGGGRGRRGAGGSGGSTTPFTPSRESSEDFRRMQLVTAEARNPPTRLMIVDTPGAVTITNQLGQSRVLHPTGSDEWIDIEGVSIRVSARRDKDQLIVVYRVEANRDVRYTYSPGAQQLVVDVEFLDRGAGDKARRVYQPGVATETAPAPPSRSAAPPSGSPAASSAPPAHEKFDSSPGAELRGLKALGILVEDLSSQAVGCGLNHDALESAVSARLTASGFSVRRNSDEDTYVYVNIMTTNLPNGTCVSRYDAFLYTHATANLSYRDVPVLVQVSLMHRGGIATTAAMSHAQAVTRGLEGYVDLFAGQIRDANK